MDEADQAINVRDPLAAALRAASDSAGSVEGRVAAILALRQIFAPEVAEGIRGPVTAAYQQLVALGARGAAGQIWDTVD